LQIKEGELEKSRATLEGIALEYQKLQNDLYKVIFYLSLSDIKITTYITS